MHSAMRFTCTLVLAIILAGTLILPALAQQETWNYLGPAGVSLLTVAVAPGNSNLIVAGGASLYVSTDGGQSWAQRSGPGSVWSIGFGSNPNVAFAGCWGYGGVYRSTDGCATWVLKNSGFGNTVVKTVCVSPTDDNTVYAGSEDGLYKSTNGGDSWTRIKSGINASAIAAAPSNSQILYLGTWGAGIWMSTDGGENWTQLTVGSVPISSAVCNGAAVDPVNADIAYVIFQGNGTWVTFDGGGTWSAISPGLEGFSIKTDPQRSGFVYAVGGWTTPHRSGSYGSTGMNGMTSGWSGFARGVAVDPNDPSKVYGTTSSGAGGVYRWTADVTAPGAPSLLTAQPQGPSIGLSWTASPSSDCTGYWIYRKEQGGSFPLLPYAPVAGRTTTTFNDTQATGGQTYTYKLAAVDAAHNRSGFTNEATATSPEAVDLDVTFIERLPHDTRFYFVQYPNDVPTLAPGTENDKRWPALGETVTFVAHFRNKGTVSSGPANYRWKMNGAVMATGTAASLGPRAEGTASLDWQWNVSGVDTDHTDQTITFEIDYDWQIAETYEENNALTDYVGGVFLFVYVEQALADAMGRMLNLVGTYSFEDWLQAQVKEMNDAFARSTYTGIAPTGCLERVRLDKIVIAPSTSVAYNSDPDVWCADGRWQLNGGENYANTFVQTYDAGLIHEWMHQIGVIDLYTYPVGADYNQVVTPDGLPQACTWGWARPGIMAGGDIAPHSGAGIWVDKHTVVGMNKNCGYRRGYYGEYQYDIPQNCYILVKDAGGVAAPSVNVRVFQITRPEWKMTNIPIITGTTDGTGRLLLTNRPPNGTVTTATGHTLRANPFANINVVGNQNVLLIEMSKPGGNFDYAWMDMTQFNIAYWNGFTSSWTYTINSRLGSGTLPRITAVAGKVEAEAGSANDMQVTLLWPAVPGASSYRIYRASQYFNQSDDPNHLYENWVYKSVGTVVGTTSFTDISIFEPSRYAVVARDAAGKQTPLSNRIFAPTLQNVQGVGVQPDNRRVILDPSGSYYLLRQLPDGVFTSYIGSVHYHLEWSRFMTVDKAQNRLVFSHPGDGYGGRHSVRVSDQDANGILEFGNYGSGPGAFNNPAGVAVDAESRIYVCDAGNNRIQVFTKDGAYITAFGAAGSGPGQFSDLHGIAVDSRHRVYVCDKGNARVQVLQFNGSTLSYLGMLQGKSLVGPYGVAVGAADNVFVTDYGSGNVESYSAYGNWMLAYSQPTDAYTGHLLRPTGIAVDNNGLLVVCDNGNRRVVTINPTQPRSVASARAAADNTLVEMDGPVVTAEFSGYFYVQDPGRLPGIRVVSAASVTVGQMVDVFGRVKTVQGEREIQQATVAAHAMSPNPPTPAGMNLRAMGGSPSGPVPGVDRGSGLNNVGLLVRVFGKVSDRNATTEEFYLDDGSGFKVRVYAPGLTIPADGSFVTVTGISGADNTSGLNLRVLRARAVEVQ